MTTYPDEYLDHWGDIFVANHLDRRGITFVQFITAPQTWLNAGLFERPDPPQHHAPLLPEQRAVARRVAIGEAIAGLQSLLDHELAHDAPTAGTRGPAGLHEPMHHLAHPPRRRARCAFRPRVTGGAS